MLRRYRPLTSIFLRSMDGVCIFLAWIIAYGIRFSLEIPAVTKGIPPFTTYLLLSVPILMLWSIFFEALKLYRPSLLIAPENEMASVLKGHALACFSMMGVTFFLSDYQYSKITFMYFSVFAAFLLWLVRSLIRVFWIKRKNTFHKVLILGKSKASHHFVERLKRYPALGIALIDWIAEEDPRLQPKAFPDLLANLKPDHIVLAPVSNTGFFLEELLKKHLNDALIELSVLPELTQWAALRCEFEEFDGIPMMTLNDSPLLGEFGF